MKDKVIMSRASHALSGYQWVEKTTAWVWAQCVDLFTVAGEAPTYRLIIDRIEGLPEKEQEDKLNEVIAIFKELPEAAPRAVIETMVTRARKLGTLEAMERASEAFEKGDDKGGLDAMEKAMRSKVIRPGIIVKPMFPKKFIMLKSQPRIPTGMYRLDRLIGGAQLQETNYVIGATGVGKSAICTTLCHSGVKAKKRVLYIDTENGEHVVTSRFYSRMTGVPYELLEQSLLSASTQAQLQVWLDRNAGRLGDLFRFTHLGFGGVTIGQVEAAIVEQIESGWPPDLVVFDSPDHVDMKGAKDAARWELFADVANQLKGVTERTNVAMWATSQAGGENIETKIATTANAADTKQKVRNAAVVISINRRIDPKTSRPVADPNARDLYVAKARNSPGGYIIPLDCDLSRMIMRAPPEFDAHGGYAEHADR